MKEFWRSKNGLWAAYTIFCIYLLDLNFCWSLNDEGVALLRFKEKIVSDPYEALSNWNDEVGVENPCSWFGVECSQGYVVMLILRNNSFSGVIPKEIANLKELEVLDLGYNNFRGQLPRQLGDNFSMTILLLDNNEFLGSKDFEIYELQKLSEVQVEENLLSRARRASSCNELVNSWNSWKTRDVSRRELLQENPFWRKATFNFLFPPPKPIARDAPAPTPTQAPAPSTSSPSSPSPITPISPPPLPAPAPAPAQWPNPPLVHSRSNHHRILILSAATGGPILLLVLIVGIFFLQSGKIATVKPWATGLSGQLQKAFLSGVPKLKRSELEAACEDFSNVIGSASVCTLYKGTLSSGVEIAVASVAVASAKDWSSRLESLFRKKIDTLSKVNHKNFVSLLGYCEEEEPFTRMMVFEYAPNGTLFEHLHIREAEHLDWSMRLRIAMGMAYCLDHMHQLTPPLPHKNLSSSSIYLTEDYAAKISDFALSDDASTSDREPPNLQSNVYSFGVVLFEMITGKLPFSAGTNSSIEEWASDYLNGTKILREMVDPTLRTFQEDQLEQIGGVIKLCVNPDPRERPFMNEVCAQLREITGIEPDGAVPRLSPLWWAELEILSTEAS
ncbi:hypothetical protein BUALT_Bualt01G0052000 [Buddleja alternifolia]|uniref:Protein kinase domain-containing protein n=1 Tax=Buddleja alternifolia TaxID=168488 RepID=A0AAV6YFI4_9LAMI|nr:hypothetical protein BUALT_Bualt01G0052000 [Buddleja alternifolia]